ncbi:MAG: sensor domain-containing diguanylate cyclase [Vulcanimicrobiota bacterium]
MTEPHGEESLRLKALAALELLDQPEEERFQRITRLVRRHFQAAGSAITLIDKERAYFLARDGMSSARETPRSKTLCSQVVIGRRPVVVSDHSPDSLTPAYQGLVEQLSLNFYAGMPLLTPDGYAVGALCVMDHIPRKFSRRELESLADFAAIVENEMLFKAAAENQRELISQVEKLRIRAFLDPLTGVWNRGGLFDVLNREVERARRSSSPLTLCMLDLDRFKRINDTYGHPVGDEVLKELCLRVRAAVRPYDALGRYGGEEFILVFPETTLQQAESQAERVREAVGGQPFQLPGAREETITISIGVAELQDEEKVEATIERADRALYRAKREGRNRVVVEEE